jgi:hypothetical protein
MRCRDGEQRRRPALDAERDGKRTDEKEAYDARS